MSKRYFIKPKAQQPSTQGEIMTLSQIIGILGFVAQIGNFALIYIQAWNPEIGLIVAGILAGIQAFSARVQGAAK